MQVATKKVQGRRDVRYDSLDELLGDAQRFSGEKVRRLGNWSQGQIYEHIARSLDSSIDGFSFSFPAPMRWIMSLLMKRKFMEKGIPAGFKAPAKFVPDETSTEQGLASLQKAIARQAEEPNRVPHPGFGFTDREQWNKFHLRHAEMHMSFLVEGE